MAAVFIPPSPHALGNMNNRRVPLADVPNAANSPLRAVATAAAAAAAAANNAHGNNAKRPRTHGRDERDAAALLQPPSKRQFVQTDEAQARRDAVLKRSASGKETPLHKKLEAARGRGQQQSTRQANDAADEERKRKQKEKEKEKDTGRHITKDNTDHIREWQRHYRKAFPQYTLYFDNIPDDVKPLVTKDVLQLGARIERFFSKAVTHVITTRPIPSASSSSSGGRSPEKSANVATIDPSVLKQDEEPLDVQQLKGKFDFDAALQRRNTSRVSGNTTQDADTRRHVDILTRARQMGIKIWALEKLNRMLDTLFEDLSEDHAAGQKPRQVKGGHAQHNLSALLKREQIHGAADRDMSVAPMDMQQFRGYYIYVHDMNEETRPVMARDYPRVADPADGAWPMLRPTAAGRCPFQDDNSAQRRLKDEQLKAKQKAMQQKAADAQIAVQRTRAATAQRPQTQNSVSNQGSRRVLVENNNLASRGVADAAGAKAQPGSPAKPLDPPKLIPAKRTTSFDSQQGLPMFGSAQASLRQLPRYAAGEPVASGIQPSNVTSAIKSQMISSTTGVPGAKAGASRQVNQLARKVLDKSSAPPSMPSSYMNDVRAAINNAPQQRASRRKTRQDMAQIEEDEEDAGGAAKREKRASGPAAQSQKKAEKDLKPGYCENCHDKFEDFDKHVLSSKHRKFARDLNNWKDLDLLLDNLRRV